MPYYSVTISNRVHVKKVVKLGGINVSDTIYELWRFFFFTVLKKSILGSWFMESVCVIMPVVGTLDATEMKKKGAHSIRHYNRHVT